MIYSLGLIAGLVLVLLGEAFCTVSPSVVLVDVNQMGKTGLVNLISPLCKATPILSVMTDDLGILHDGSTCPCGVKSPYLEIVGRVAPEDIKTCAAGAADILQGVKV